MEFVCIVWITEQPANFALHSIKRLVFITVVESVYSAVRTESLYDTDRLCFVFKGLTLGIETAGWSSDCSKALRWQ
jgi:hypothetical protein